LGIEYEEILKNQCFSKEQRYKQPFALKCVTATPTQMVVLDFSKQSVDRLFGL